MATMVLEGPVCFSAFDAIASEVVGESRWCETPREDQESLWTSMGSPNREKHPVPMCIQAADAALEDIADELPDKLDKAAFVCRCSEASRQSSVELRLQSNDSHVQSITCTWNTSPEVARKSKSRRTSLEELEALAVTEGTEGGAVAMANHAAMRG